MKTQTIGRWAILSLFGALLGCTSSQYAAPTEPALTVEVKAPPTLTATPTLAAIPTFGFEYPWGYYEPSVASLLGPQVLAYLNAGGSADALEPLLLRMDIRDEDDSARVFNVAEPTVLLKDVTGDGRQDVVVGLYIDPGEGALLIYSKAKDSYQLIAQQQITSFFDERYSAPPAIKAVADVTGNGIPEIFFGMTMNVSQHDAWGGVEVYEWNGEALADLSPRSESNNWSELGLVDDRTQGRTEVIDIDKDGQLELVLTDGSQSVPYFVSEADPEKYRTHQRIWAWNGKEFFIECLRWIGVPDKLFDAVESGDDHLRCGFYQQAAEYYEQAVEDRTLLPWNEDCYLNHYEFYGGCVEPIITAVPDKIDPDEYPRLGAYARYRLVLAQLALQQVDQARATYEILQQETSPGNAGYPYAQLAGVFWESYQAGGDLAAACEDALQYAADHEDEIVRPFDMYYPRAPKEYLPQVSDFCLPSHP